MLAFLGGKAIFTRLIADCGVVQSECIHFVLVDVTPCDYTVKTIYTLQQSTGAVSVHQNLWNDVLSA